MAESTHGTAPPTPPTGPAPLLDQARGLLAELTGTPWAAKTPEELVEITIWQVTTATRVIVAAPTPRHGASSRTPREAPPSVVR